MLTIYAPASMIGSAGITVFRVSGEKAFEGLEALTGEPFPKTRQATVRDLYHPETKQKIDEGLVVLFKNPQSFTGEDVVEYHVHGGHAVAEAIMAAFSLLDEHRLAEPGEFTRRAFENGKMDLTQAEAVADLIHAETEGQRVLALDQLSGSLRNLYEDWAEKLSASLANIEADIDFADEDLPDELSLKVRPVLQAVLDDIIYHLDDNRRGERLRNGIKIAVIGAPNAGKSSLINALAERDIAIVADIPGTTRDIIEVHLNIAGLPVIVADTAGLRQTDDSIEKEGIKRAKSWSQQADFTLALFDSGTSPDEETKSLINRTTLICSTKTDQNSPHLEIAGQKPIALSIKDKKGLDDLLFHVKQSLENFVKTDRENGPTLTRNRHRQALEEARDHLIRACAALQIDMMAEDVRLTVRSLGKITGCVDIEDLLDRIFNDFCIGK